MCRSILFVVAALLVSATNANAQAPFPGAVNIDGGWVPCSHPIAIARGLGCGSTPEPTPPPTPEECAHVNPYTQMELAKRCQNQPPAPLAEPTFQIGHVYAFAYRDVQAVVIGISRDIDDVQVVTYRWLSGAGSGVGAMRTPASPGGSSSPWTYVGPMPPK
jgi:hypothetical protein